jgi:hypothetical protein
MTADQPSGQQLADVPRPGSVPDSKTHTLGATTMAISADKITWAFFESHPLRT